MKKVLLLMWMMSMSLLTFSQISVKINEPIRFKDLNTRSLEGDYLVGEGSFEVSTDKVEEDLGKKIVFMFPETGFMTNKKNTIKVEKYGMETEEKSMIVSTKREIVKFYAFIKRRDILKNKDPKVIEGEYVGRIPVVFSIYENIRDKEN